MKYLVLFITILSTQVFGQYCVPTNNCSDGDVINNFTFHTISSTNSGCNNTTSGYTLHSTSVTVKKGNSYDLTIQSGSAWEQGFGIWIDFNGDNDFNDAGEFVYTSGSSSTNAFTGTISIPSNTPSITTQMRVRSRYGNTFNSNQSCLDVNYGETEDYTIVIESNTAPPIADFKSNTTATCSGLIAFNDQSENQPTSWLWYFGDGNTSTLQNPSHVYTSDGVYDVSLVVTNAFGKDSISKQNFISVNLSTGIPIAPLCVPNTTEHFGSGFGITYFSFHTINNPSENGSAGYEDFTCYATYLLAGRYYPISVICDVPQEHNVRIWLDMNNNGVFASSELIYSADKVFGINDSILIPSIITQNTPLRLRVAADFYIQNAPDGCSDLKQGQAEDYTVVVLPNTNPPSANFTQNKTFSCDGIVSFTDLSSDGPNFWSWNFGDGNTSSQKNPTHQYTTNGSYTVSLQVSNNFGNNSISKSDLIEVNFDGNLIPASCSPSTSSYCCGYGIYGVYFNTISNGSPGGSEGYQDYSCENNTSLGKDGCYEILVRTGPDNNEDVKIWLDLNNDGQFDETNELVFSSFSKKIHQGKLTIPSSGVVLDKPLRMRIISDFSGSQISPCKDPQWGQVEDYAVTVLSTNSEPTVFISSDTRESCDGIVQFYDESCGSPTQWLWNFGDGKTSTEQNPIHIYQNPGNYNITLTVWNNNSSSTKVFTTYVRVLSLFGIPKPMVCTPQTKTPFQDIGISRVRIGAIDHSTGAGLEGYQDYTCIKQTTALVGQVLPIIINTSKNYQEDVYIWIDYNNDGIFSAQHELVFSSTYKTETHSGTIKIPTSNVSLDKPLRLRVTSDYAFDYNIGPCTRPEYGQTEDYTIFIKPANSSPTAAFGSDSTTICLGTVNFYNYSSSNASTFLWNFGDGNTSTLNQPSHTYTSPGRYTVSLKATNNNGSNTMTVANYINLKENCIVAGIMEDKNEFSANIFPNPTNGYFTIELIGYSNQTNIEIYNTSGGVVFQHTTNERINNIDLNGVSAGFYFVKIISDKNVEIKKLIIQ
jgi:PKD repeat protein